MKLMQISAGILGESVRGVCQAVAVFDLAMNDFNCHSNGEGISVGEPVN